MFVKLIQEPKKYQHFKKKTQVAHSQNTKKIVEFEPEMRNEGFKTRTKRKRRVFKKPNVERIERRLERTKTLFCQTWNENQNTFLLVS